MFGFRTLCRQEAMPLVLRLKDHQLIRFTNAVNAVSANDYLVHVIRRNNRDITQFEHGVAQANFACW